MTHHFVNVIKNIHLQHVSLVLCIAFHAIATLCFSLTLRHEFKSAAQDGATFAQLLYNVLQGHGLVTTIFPPGVEQHWLGIHFSPVLYLLAPLYYLFPHIEMLLGVHSFFIALAAWPIFMTAQHVLHSRWLALMAAMLYLINPYVINGALWDFHEIAFAPLLIAFILWAVVCKKRSHFIIFCALLLLVKEHYGIAVFGSGLLWAWHWKEWRFGSAVALCGLFAVALVMTLIMPHFSISNQLVWTDSTQAGWVQRFSWLQHPFDKDSPILHIISDGISYISHLVLLFWLIPLVEFVWWLPVIADLAVNTLSYFSIQKSEYSYHSIAVIPAVITATVVFISKRFTAKTNLKPFDVLITLLLTSGFGAYQFVVAGNIWEISTPQVVASADNRTALLDIEQLIPTDAAVAAQFNALPHLRPRRQLTQFPQSSGHPDYIVLYTAYPFTHPTGVFDSPYGYGGGMVYFAAARRLFSDHEWHVVYFSKPWLVLQKHGKENAAARMSGLQDFTSTERAFYDMLCRDKTHTDPA